MKKLIGLMLVAFAATSAFAANDCASVAAEKKLAGAAKNSFMKKCEREAQGAPQNTACAATAKEKKLAGAAKTSFMKKCTADAEAGAAK